MTTNYYRDFEGNHKPDRRENEVRRIPSWLDYTVVSFVLGLIFSAGIQYNRLDDVSKRIDGIATQLQVINASDSKPDIAVLKERTHQQDQAISDLKDTLLRRLDRMDVKMDENQRINSKR